MRLGSKSALPLHLPSFFLALSASRFKRERLNSTPHSRRFLYSSNNLKLIRNQSHAIKNPLKFPLDSPELKTKLPKLQLLPEILRRRFIGYRSAWDCGNWGAGKGKSQRKIKGQEPKKTIHPSVIPAYPHGHGPVLKKRNAGVGTLEFRDVSPHGQ